MTDKDQKTVLVVGGVCIGVGVGAGVAIGYWRGMHDTEQKYHARIDYLQQQQDQELKKLKTPKPSEDEDNESA